MDQNLLQALAKELASRVNRMVNIPLVSEAQEQVFFEMIIGIVLDLILKALGKDSLNRLTEEMDLKAK
ncbi:MAG: hypothetical protein U1B83_00930 [Candidatus Cloacimonadaceae bacterium]|nr:hypothetical protein [Candidatus Cloacimonadaceae bacterium]